MTRRRRQVAVDDVAYVSIRCTAESHQAEPVPIQTFRAEVDARQDPPRVYWVEDAKGYRIPGERFYRARPNSTQIMLSSDRPLDQTTYEGRLDVATVQMRSPETIRTRYQLECHKCGLNVPATAETLFRALELVYGHSGNSQVSLALIGAMLRRSSGDKRTT